MQVPGGQGPGQLGFRTGPGTVTVTSLRINAHSPPSSAIHFWNRVGRALGNKHLSPTKVYPPPRQPQQLGWGVRIGGAVGRAQTSGETETWSEAGSGCVHAVHP